MDLKQKNKVKVGGGLSAISAVVLVMLVFFLIMTVVSKKDEKAAIPEADDDFTPAVTVVITQDNRYYLLPDETDRDKRSFDEIRDLIGSRVVASETRQLQIRGHQLAKYETIYNVAALAQKNHWQYRLDYTKQPADE
jgi:biopolymer transport protein ExbD